jgi:two-component system response regulator NreC
VRVTRVLVVDDHELVRLGIRQLLEAADGIEVVAATGDADDALVEARRARPDVVVLDIALGGQSGLELVGELRALGARVVILSIIDDAAHVKAALERGAQGYVVKESAVSQLVDAIRCVLDDRLYLPPELAPELVQGVGDDGLTDREAEVLRLYALGYTNNEIAGELVLSVRTVETHRQRILEKLRLNSRADLVRYALDRRLIGGPF